MGLRGVAIMFRAYGKGFRDIERVLGNLLLWALRVFGILP